MENIRHCIIIGGGKSIEPYRKELAEKTKDQFTIVINYGFLHFPHTCMCFGDTDFYFPSKAKQNPGKYPDIYEKLKNESLIIYNNEKNKLKDYQLPNTIYVKSGCGYNTNPLKMGFYHHVITGIFALSLAQFLMDYNGIIFLCGFDWSRNKPNEQTEIHYYSDQELYHKGKHKTDYYHNNNPDNFFGHFKEPNIKIYNVSEISSINSFEKISYNQMFNLLIPQEIDQNKIRKYIKEKLCIK